MAPQTRIAHLKQFLTLVADQVLLFWPPYRMEIQDQEQRLQIIPVRPGGPAAAAPIRLDRSLEPPGR